MKHLLSIVFLLFPMLSAVACNVPVFRYALERWENDPFQLVVFHEGALTADLSSELDKMEPLATATDARPNWKIARVDVSKPVPELWTGLWKKEQGQPLPRMVLCTPEWTKNDDALMSAPLTKASLTDLGTSPKRAEVLAHLLKGTAVVWIVAETKDKKASAGLLALIQDESVRLKDAIGIPPNIGKDGVNVLSDLPVEVSFAIVRVDVDDPAEATLVKLLNNGEPITEPMLYPVFGRGRALAAMPNSTVNKELLEETARFLCGACSCQVKAQNPGFDLLVSTNWQQIFGEDAAPPPQPKTPASSKPVYVPLPKKKG